MHLFSSFIMVNLNPMWGCLQVCRWAWIAPRRCNLTRYSTISHRLCSTTWSDGIQHAINSHNNVCTCKHKSLKVCGRQSLSGLWLVFRAWCISFCCVPLLDLYTHRHMHSALAVFAASLLCSWSISLRAVFGAWGQWEQTGGREAGGCICQGTSFRGPTVAWLSFHVCLQKHSSVEGEREKGRQRRCHCYFPVCRQSVVWGGGVCQRRAASHFLVFHPQGY